MKHKIYVGLGILLVILAISVIPVFFNFLLRQQTPIDVNVISDPNSGPGIWLVFWGSYLAAIGSFTMALVAYLQNKHTQETNDKHFMFEVKYRRYEHLEKFIKYSSELHSTRILYEILEEIRKGDYHEAESHLSKYCSQLSCITLDLVRYEAIFQTQKMKEFGPALRKYNEVYVEIATNLMDFIQEHINTNTSISTPTPVEDINKSILDFKNQIETKTSTRISSDQQLQHIGFDLLQQEMDSINQTTNNIAQ